MHEQLISDYIEQSGLPDAFRSVATEHYMALAAQLSHWRHDDSMFCVGINGAQGTGKSTLAGFLAVACKALHGWRVAVLSIDDFYLTRDERHSLSQTVHPLFATRGVPGTHDVDMLSDCIARLKTLRTGQTASLPRFDKSIDDRADPAEWPIVEGPIDLLILEGWCVGSKAQSDDELDQAVNALERDEDTDAVWRRHANRLLQTQYAEVFAALDRLVFLRAPGFDAIHRWRAEQEERLRARKPNADRLLGDAGLSRFIQHYERITRANLETLPELADAVIELADDHTVAGTRFTD